MTFELYCLAWTLVLAIAQILAAAQARTAQTGLGWSAGPRDEQPGPPSILAGRLQRAQANLFETLPLFAAAVLIAVVAGRTGTLSWWGSLLYLLGRVVYVPLYAAGVPVVRSLVWGVALVGLVLVLLGILVG